MNSDVFIEYDESGNPRINADADKYGVYNIAKRDAYRERQIIENSRLCAPFTFTHMDNIKYVIANVPDKHCGYLLYLQCFIDYEGRILHPNNRPMNKQDIANKLKLSIRSFREFMRYMIHNGIIRCDDGVYSVDKRYHWRGALEQSRAIKSFIDTVKQLYTDTDAKDLGFIYKLLPYVHWETNFICSNPNELNPDEIIPLNKSDIAELTGMTEKSVYTKLRNLKLGDEYVFADVAYGKSHYCVINHRLFYRKDGYPDATLRAIFAISDNYRRRRQNIDKRDKLH